MEPLILYTLGSLHKDTYFFKINLNKKTRFLKKSFTINNIYFKDAYTVKLGNGISPD